MPASRRWYHPAAIVRSLMIRPRVYCAAVIAISAFLLCPSSLPRTERLTLAWNAGALTYLWLAFRMMAAHRSEQIRRTAAAIDDSRIIILGVILLSIGASFVAIAQLIGHAKLAPGDSGERIILAALAFVTIIVSWSVTQVAFTLHYAHAFYRPDRGSDAGGGLDFPGCDEPDYWDFLYFATSIGATSQTSDTAIRSRALRRLATVHAVVAFFFNTAVLALTVNLAASLA